MLIDEVEHDCDKYKLIDKFIKDETFIIKYFDYLNYGFKEERMYCERKYDFPMTNHSPYIALRFSKKSSDELNGTNKYTKRLNFIVFFHLRFNHDEKKTYVDSCTCDFISWYVLTNYDYFYVKNNEINVKNNSLGGHYYFKTLIDIPNYQNLNFSELFDYITNYINTNSKKYFRKLSFLFAVQSQYRIKKIFFDWLKYIDNCSFTDLSFSQIINYLWKKTHANFDNLYYSEALHKNILNDTVFFKIYR